MVFLCASYIGNKAPKTSGTSLMTNTFMNIIMTIRFSLAWLCSNTINHTTIAGFRQLDFQVELMDNLLFRYSSHATWNTNCTVAVLSQTCQSLHRHNSSLPPAMALQICLSSSAKEISDAFLCLDRQQSRFQATRCWTNITPTKRDTNHSNPGSSCGMEYTRGQ